MELTDFLNFTDNNLVDSSFISKHVTFLTSNSIHLEKQNFQVAILGVPDEENANTFEVAYQVRNQLYQLATVSNNLSIIDLGNIKVGSNHADTCINISEVFQEINRHTIIIVLIGGTSKFNFGSYLAYQKNGQPLNMVSIDSRISREVIPECVVKHARSLDDENSLSFFNYINIGYQSYFVPQSVLDIVDDSYYEAYRLGTVRNNIQDMEPILRDSNFVNFSLNSVKHSDAPGAGNSSPNGLSGYEACQLSFYAGHSNRISSLGIFDIALLNDIHRTTVKLAAQVIWYFCEGLANRILEEPDSKPQNFTKYLIYNNNSKQDLAFYQSNLTNRWWMEISFSAKSHNVVLACSENDYELACKQEIPDRWWRMFHRIQ